jgi:pyruvate dehydrogenase E2 component (dihydrolipoamide acetyltransferase)
VIATNNFPSAESNSDLDVKASPLAKKLANEKGINLKFVNGTGTEGRIIKRDIDNFQGKSIVSGQESFQDEPVSQMRKVIAQRLAESKFTAPHFYLTVSIDMDNAIEVRKSINSSISPSKISFNDFVVKAVAASLIDHPKVNASWHGDFIRYNKHVHIGVAVAVDDGLLVPVVRFANEKSLTQIGEEVKLLAQKAKDKKLQPEEWESNTFTISNLGMFGIDEFTAIINTPDACILAIGGIQQVPVVKNGEIVPGNTMKVTLSCDHRVVDGAVGSSFLNTFKNYLENPVLLLGKDSI